MVLEENGIESVSDAELKSPVALEVKSRKQEARAMFGDGGRFGQATEIKSVLAKLEMSIGSYTHDVDVVPIGQVSDNPYQ